MGRQPSAPKLHRPPCAPILAPLPLFAVVVALLAGGSCDEPCCQDNADCVDGARCFEGTCSLRCEADSMCDEGQTCSAAGVCREINPVLTLARCQDGGG